MMKYLFSYMFLLVFMIPPCITAGNLTRGLNIGTTVKDISKDIAKTGANYEVTDYGKLCSSNLDQYTIQTEAECRQAASQLGYIFRRTYNLNGGTPGCYRRYRFVLFNTSPNPGTTVSESTKSICSKGTKPPCQCGVKGRRRIVGGINGAVFPGEWPWIVLLTFGETDGSNQKNYGADCGGTLVASQWILTAAHCFFHLYENENVNFVDYKQVIFANMMSAVIGEHKIRTTDDEYDTKRKNLEIVKIIIHPEYDSPKIYSNDIALLKLKKPVDLSVYMPACLLPEGKDWSGNTGWVYGWGDIYDGFNRPSNTLRETYLKIITNTECTRMTGKYLGEQIYMDTALSQDMMCAENIGRVGSDACQGDSGGPFTVAMNYKHYLAGIVSWGLGCATPNLPGVFANVSYLRKWIDDTVEVNGRADFCSGL